MTTIDDLSKRFDKLERELEAARMQISQLQSAQTVMDRRILEQLRGINSDFENRVVQTVNEAQRKGRITI